MMLRKSCRDCKNAEAQAEEKFNSSLKKIDSRKEDILEAAAKERELISERIKASAGLKARNEKLKAKQTVIERVEQAPKKKSKIGLILGMEPEFGYCL